MQRKIFSIVLLKRGRDVVKVKKKCMMLIWIQMGDQIVY